MVVKSLQKGRENLAKRSEISESRERSTCDLHIL